MGDGTAELSFVPFARRRYEILRVDVTGRDAESALRAALPESTARDSYRVIFTGETDERGLALEVLRERFAPDFFSLELRDETRIGESVWARASEDSLRGLFLRELRAKFDAASSEEERAQLSLAARYGLAALDGRDLRGGEPCRSGTADGKRKENPCASRRWESLHSALQSSITTCAAYCMQQALRQRKRCASLAEWSAKSKETTEKGRKEFPFGLF